MTDGSNLIVNMEIWSIYIDSLLGQPAMVFCNVSQLVSPKQASIFGLIEEE